MAAVSIVDFVKDSLAKGSASLGSNGGANPGLDDPALIQLLQRVAAGAPAALVSSPNESVYVSYASKVMAVLQRDTAGMTARQVFDATGDDNFSAFQLALAEMARRGLIHVSGRDPKYGDEIYSLSSAAAA
jgi:hypothetical protein